MSVQSNVEFLKREESDTNEELILNIRMHSSAKLTAPGTNPNFKSVVESFVDTAQSNPIKAITNSRKCAAFNENFVKKIWEKIQIRKITIRRKSENVLKKI